MARATASLTIWTCISFLMQLVAANVEKVVFLGPPSTIIPDEQPNLDQLDLLHLSPSNFSIRTHVLATFPTPASPRGQETWLLLDGLEEGRRYEVRICWIATVGDFTSFLSLFTQPTAPLSHIYSSDRLCSKTRATLRNTCQSSTTYQLTLCISNRPNSCFTPTPSSPSSVRLH